MAGIKEEKKIYLVGIYCRLSKDDGTDNESASIATQKSILTDYVKKQGWHIAKTYVDDGYSGTNFQRPSFQNMIKDIESGLINCVITKDLSRLGRNYLDYITDHFYTCSDKILCGLGRMYAGGGELTENIDDVGEVGTAEFASKAIDIFYMSRR